MTTNAARMRRAEDDARVLVSKCIHGEDSFGAALEIASMTSAELSLLVVALIDLTAWVNIEHAEAVGRDLVDVWQETLTRRERAR